MPRQDFLFSSESSYIEMRPLWNLHIIFIFIFNTDDPGRQGLFNSESFNRLSLSRITIVCKINRMLDKNDPRMDLW